MPCVGLGMEVGGAGETLSRGLDPPEPLWKMVREAVPLLMERTKTCFNHDGIFYSETMHPWGLNKQGDFGYGNARPHLLTKKKCGES